MTVLADKAKAAGCDYITPEDVQEAINEGVDRIELWGELLAILGKKRGLGVEDASLCASVAYDFKKE